MSSLPVSSANHSRPLWFSSAILQCFRFFLRDRRDGTLTVFIRLLVLLSYVESYDGQGPKPQGGLVVRARTSV